MTTDSAKTKRSGRRPLALKLGVAAVVAVALFFLARQIGYLIPEFAAWVETLGFWGPAVFILGYALAVILFAPGALLTLAGGAIFGIAEGTLYVFAAAVLGSTGAFLVARYLARGFVEERLGNSDSFRAIDRAVGEQGRKITFLLRLSPAFPFNVLNYALGLTRMTLADYVMASVGMLPGTLLYVYYGKLAGDVAALAGGVETPKDSNYYLVLGLGLAATIGVTAVVTRVARRALAEATGEAPPSPSAES